RRQKLHSRSVKIHAVEMAKIGIVIRFTAAPFKENHAVLFVDAQHPPDREVALSDLILELTGRKVVKIKMPPTCAFGYPAELIFCTQVAPIHGSLTGFELGRLNLFVDVTNLSGRGIGHSEIFYFVIAGGRNKRDRF